MLSIRDYLQFAWYSLYPKLSHLAVLWQTFKKKLYNCLIVEVQIDLMFLLSSYALSYPC